MEVAAHVQRYAAVDTTHLRESVTGSSYVAKLGRFALPSTHVVNGTR